MKANIKGAKLINARLPSSNSSSLNATESDKVWLLGCLCLFVACCCWSFWLIIQIHTWMHGKSNHICNLALVYMRDFHMCTSMGHRKKGSSIFSNVQSFEHNHCHHPRFYIFTRTNIRWKCDRCNWSHNRIVCGTMG
ncbi:unnamed protein product [Lactuca virosa]|uniref:Uncharacterized protein n=1 Tax=Lactuca virosa TaxID=75947 RepID=A0AAU9MFB6_9ASTR|nr:unnamed protein product [Lactuca virosa]